MRRFANIAITFLAVGFLTGCKELYFMDFSVSDTPVNLDISVALSDISPFTRADAALTEDSEAANDNEKMKSLRIIIVRPDGTVEHNRFISLSAVTRHGSERFKVKANEEKTIYLFANEKLTVIKNQDPVDASMKREFIKFDFNTIKRGGKFPKDEIEKLTIGINSDTEELGEALPMNERHTVSIEDIDKYCELFVTRATVKFSFIVTNRTGGQLNIDSLYIKELSRVEYYLPKDAKYDILPDGTKGIVEYDVPNNGNNDYYTFKKASPNVIENNGTVAIEPVYLLESKYTDPKNSSGDEGQKLNYSLGIRFKEFGTVGMEYFDNLEQLPRNTHVVAYITVTGKSEIEWEVYITPYTSKPLDPEFGI